MNLMRLRRLVVLCLFLLAGSLWLTAQSNPAEAFRAHFVGAWKLISVETIRTNGEIIYPFYGKHPEGLLVYDSDGWMSVQIVSDPHPVAPKADSREDFMAAPPGEKVTAVEGYYAYYGTWTADAANQTVIHHIVQSLYPGERGEEGTRHVVFDGNRLTLTAKTHEMGEEHQRKLVWDRVPPNARN
jgi:hypothetical protein